VPEGCARYDNASMAPFPCTITIGEKYDRAMAITEQAQADEYFERCVEHAMRCFGASREEAEIVERAGLAYYAGYFDNTVRERVERLFHCGHPVFGKMAERGASTAKEALAVCLKLAQELWK
jgi:hypothetical protein